MWIPKAIVSDVNAAVRVFYVGRDAVRHFNGKGEMRVFTGWYWAPEAGARAALSVQ